MLDTVGGDGLTRTTLQIGDGLTPPSIAELVTALHRVPGVLRAEIGNGNARAIVAHDAAVPPAALLAAAQGAGVPARIVVAPRAAGAATNLSIPVLPLTDASNRRVLMVAAALLFVLALAETIVPHLANDHFLVPILLSALWAFVIASMILRRSR